MAEVHRLTEDEVLLVRRRMATYAEVAKRDFGQTEPLHPDRLASAVFRQYTASGGTFKYNTISEIGANLFYGVAMGHAFENGNKRTALVALLVFLDKNKTQLVNADDDDLYELARSVAAHDIPLMDDNLRRNAESESQSVAEWLHFHVRPIVLGDTAMDFRDLRDLLVTQGCTFDKPVGNFIKIRRQGYSVKTGHPRPNFQVKVGQVKRIRKYLGLDEGHGVDSASFYWLDAVVDDAVLQYRNLMSRLADL